VDGLGEQVANELWDNMVVDRRNYLPDSIWHLIRSWGRVVAIFLKSLRDF